MAPPIPEELVAFLESGLSIFVASADPDREPECIWASALRASPDRRRVTVYVPAATGERTASNLRGSGLVAVTLAQVTDNRSVQVKGVSLAVREGGAQERDFVESTCAKLYDQLELVGWPRFVTERISIWPTLAIDVRVDEIYQQTPGPGAGSPLGGARP